MDAQSAPLDGLRIVWEDLGVELLRNGRRSQQWVKRVLGAHTAGGLVDQPPMMIHTGVLLPRGSVDDRLAVNIDDRSIEQVHLLEQLRLRERHVLLFHLKHCDHLQVEMDSLEELDHARTARRMMPTEDAVGGEQKECPGLSDELGTLTHFAL